MPDVFVSKPKEASVEKEKKRTEELKMEKSENKINKTPSVKRKFYPHNPLSSFIFHPKKANFANKDPEEKILLVLRKHPVTNLGNILVAIAMLFAPLVLDFFPILDFLPERFKFISVIIWYLITTAYIFEKFLTWYFNVNIITDERVFDVDFVHLTYREMTDANIDQIQDVTVRMGSVVRTIFNYGDILIQTAAEVPQIVFEAVPKPDEISKILRELRVEEEEEKLEGRVR